MNRKSHHSGSRRFVSVGLACLTGLASGAPAASAAEPAATRSPIKHVIVIIGENRTFDHVFATYKPKPGETVDNLLSKGIIDEHGAPGPNFSLATQFAAVDSNTDGYLGSPMDKSLYSTLPAPLAGGPTTPFISSLAEAQAVENGLPNTKYYTFLTTGGTGLAARTPDTRIQNDASLPPGPFQLTSSTFPYDAYAASPVHRFYQMWQQLDCNALYATEDNPSGCKGDLFPWVETTV